MSGPWVEIEAVCEVHHGSGCVVVRREGDRIVLDAHADHCCVLTLEGPAVTLLFDVLGELVEGPGVCRRSAGLRRGM